MIQPADSSIPVMIAEDDPVSRTLVTAVVEKAGFPTIVTTDGDEAIAALEARARPCVAVVDWMMPGMNGTEVCRRARAGGKDVYIIMLTSRASKEDTVQAIDIGADDYMVKPFDQEELVARIRTGVRHLHSHLELHAQIDELAAAVTEIKVLKFQLAAVRVAAPAVLVLMDDGSIVRALFEIYLSSFGYRVLVARSGEEALRMVSSRSDVRALIVDVDLAGLSAQELIDQATAALPGLAILLHSGQSIEKLATDGINLSTGRFLQKPFNAADLKRKMLEALALT